MYEVSLILITSESVGATVRCRFASDTMVFVVFACTHRKFYNGFLPTNKPLGLILLRKRQIIVTAGAQYASVFEFLGKWKRDAVEELELGYQESAGCSATRPSELALYISANILAFQFWYTFPGMAKTRISCEVHARDLGGHLHRESVPNVQWRMV